MNILAEIKIIEDLKTIGEMFEEINKEMHELNEWQKLLEITVQILRLKMQFY